MSLSYEDIEDYLCKIFLGKEFVYLNDELLTLVFPSNETRHRATLVYRRAYENALNGGMLSAKDLEELLDRKKFISSEEIQKLKVLQGQLEAQEILLGKTTRVKANQDRIKSAIRRLKHEIADIQFKKQSKMMLSADTKAEEEKSFYICSRCIYREDGSLFWKTYTDAEKETNLKLRESILIAFLRFNAGIPTSIMRQIARSSLWRIRYINSTKTSDPLFGIPTSEYTTDQLSLVYWSNFYQNIYEMMPEDRPSDMVIEDDDALDAYMKSYYEERSRTDAARKDKAKKPGKLSAFESEEVIVTRSHELYQDIEYDSPKEAQKLKDRIDLKKRTRRG